MSDKRWKSVERSTAAYLTRILSDTRNMSPVERIPLLGREGPDLTINETLLVINVKSRKRIPVRLMAPAKTLLWSGDLVGFRLDHLLEFTSCDMGTKITDPWKQLDEWYAHMDQWTRQFQADGISAIFLHRPRMPIGLTTVVIHHNDFRRLACQLKTPTL